MGISQQVAKQLHFGQCDSGTPIGTSLFAAIRTPRRAIPIDRVIEAPGSSRGSSRVSYRVFTTVT